MATVNPDQPEPISSGEPSPGAALVLRRVCNELNSELTPGLIHEVNNVLTGIFFNLEGCQEVSGSDGPAAEALREITGGVERIKEILSRTTQIHLNVAERETTYHDLESLAKGQLDLLRVVFPKTVAIRFLPPDGPVHVKVAEFPFRTALLSVASRLRPFLPSGKIEVSLSVLSAVQVAGLSVRLRNPVPRHSVAVAFRIPCTIDSAAEIDEYPAVADPTDITAANAQTILAAAGGSLIFCNDSKTETCDVLLVMPPCDLNP